MTENEEFFDECLREHNRFRHRHGVAPLRHSFALHKSAQEWAESILLNENITNSPLSNRGEIGESISKRTSTKNETDLSGYELTAQWYNDIRSYNFETGTGAAGNFTQMVWAGTREVGFGKARGRGQCLVVAHYRPPGNVRGRYIDNVFPSIQEEPVGQPNNHDGDQITKRTIIKDKKIDSNGNERPFIREITEFKDVEGNIHRRIKESYLDDQNKATDPGAPSNRVPQHHAQILPTQPSKLSLVEFSEDMLNHHNRYRRLHGAEDLVLNGRMCSMAQEWADFLVDEACLSNSGFTLDGLRLGENISSRWSNGQLEESAKDVVDYWYQEASRFKYDQEPISIQGIGNFTQIVWSATRSLGVGRAIRLAKKSQDKGFESCPFSSKTVVVCFYFPPGNVASYFNKNVRLPLATPTSSDAFSTPTPTVPNSGAFSSKTG